MKICRKCGSTQKIHRHHKIPLEAGGKDIPENIIILCASCHSKEHHRIRQERWDDAFKNKQQVTKMLGWSYLFTAEIKSMGSIWYLELPSTLESLLSKNFHPLNKLGAWWISESESKELTQEARFESFRVMIHRKSGKLVLKTTKYTYHCYEQNGQRVYIKEIFGLGNKVCIVPQHYYMILPKEVVLPTEKIEVKVPKGMGEILKKINIKGQESPIFIETEDVI